MIKNITRELLLEWRACYTDERIAELVPPEGLTPLQVLDLPIPWRHALWVLRHEEVVPDRELRLFDCRCARRACERAGWSDARSLEAIRVAEAYANGEATASELYLARAAAADAAADAAKEAWAAQAAARAAARAAASELYLAQAAARAADAADAAAYEQEAQREDLRRMLEGLR